MSPASQVEWLTPEVARRILAFQRARDEMLGTGFFAEPSWQIILSCIGYSQNGIGLDRAELAKHVTCGEETLGRWLALLAENGIVATDRDGRRYHLTENTLNKLTNLRF